MRPSAGDIGHPNPIGCIDFKLPIQCVVGDTGRIAARTTGAAFAAALRRSAGRPRNTVLGPELTSIQQIIHCPAVDCKATDEKGAACDTREPCRCQSTPVQSGSSDAHPQAHAGLRVL